MKLNELDQKLRENPEFVQAMDDLKLHFELANAVLRARLKKGWSQTQLAKAVGTKQANISRIETGLANPTITLVRKLTKALDLEIQFVGSTTQETPLKFSTSSRDAAIRVNNWPVCHSEPQYKQISDASAEGEGYQV